MTVPKLLMDILILTQHYKGYDIIKHINQDCLHRVYFDPKNTLYFKGMKNDLLCKDLATSAIIQIYQIVKNVFYSVSSLTANRFSCSRCIWYKGNIYFHESTSFRQLTFHNDAWITHGLNGSKMCRRTITQRAIQKKCKCSFFSCSIWWFRFFSCTKSKKS